MDVKMNQTTIEAIRTVANRIKGKKLKNLQKAEKELLQLNEFFGTTSLQTALFVAIFDFHCCNRTSNFDDLADYFKCTTLDIFSLKSDFDILLKKRLIIKNDAKELNLTNVSYKIKKNVFDFVLDNKSLSQVFEETTKFDNFNFIKMIGEWVENRQNSNLSTKDLLTEIERQEQEHVEIPMIKELCSLISDTASRTLFYNMCNDMIDALLPRSLNFRGNTEANYALTDIYDNMDKVMEIKKQLSKGEHCLQKVELIEHWETDENICLALSEKGMKLFLQQNASLYINDNLNLDQYSFVRLISDSIEERKTKKLSIGFLIRKALKIEHKNPLLNLVISTQRELPDINDRIFFYEMCDDLLNKGTSLECTINDIYQSPTEQILKKRSFFNQKNPLIEKNIAELGKASFLGDTPITLTDKGKRIFLEEDFDLFLEPTDKKSCIQVEDIKEKHLFFENELEQQLNFLKDNLQEETFQNLRSRLEEMALPKGIAAIFYGLPGTGKTESVFQIAKDTGRGVMQVDISEMKTCWYGESQKLVRSVFRKYERLCKSSKATPILLFNEADAIFSKRHENTNQSVDQTENAIQNIILEEMEKLYGILIATTNMAGNLDAAFERRFLFKIKFEKPSLNAKAQIRRDKLKYLDEPTALSLAEKFDFSGGEIDNIVRKVTMNQVLTGELANFEMLTRLCKDERLRKSGNKAKVGF